MATKSFRIFATKEDLFSIFFDFQQNVKIHYFKCGRMYDLVEISDITKDKLTAFLSKLLMLLVLCLCSILLTAIIFGIGFGRIASSDIEIMKGCIFAALLLWGSSVPLYLWQLILAFQFGKGVSIGAGIISGLISALMLTGLGDYVWKYVFVCWTGRVPYTYLQSVLGETSVGEWLSFIPGCLIFTGISMVYYFWWVNHWEGNRISE